MQKLAYLLNPQAAFKHLWFCRFVFVLKTAFFVCSLVYLYFELHTKEALLPGIGARWASSWRQPAFLLFLTLAPLNWLLEAMKWKLLVVRIEKISLVSAFRGVLSGVAFSAFSHHLVGHYFGRLLHLTSDKRAYSLAPNLLGSVFQTYWSVFFGCLGLMLHMGYEYPLQFVAYFSVNVLLWFLALSILARAKKAKQPSVFRLPSFFYPHLASISEIPAFSVWGALTVSFVRYCVFYFQFALLLGLFCPDLAFWEVFTGISLVYLGKTLLPKFNFINDLGLREASAIYAFGNFNAPADGLLAATFSLWLANLCLPMLAGAFLVFLPKYLGASNNV